MRFAFAPRKRAAAPGRPSCRQRADAPQTFEERLEVKAANKRFAAFMNEWLPILNEARASQGLQRSESCVRSV